MPKSPLLTKTPQFVTSAKGQIPRLLPINLNRANNVVAPAPRPTDNGSSIDKDLLAAQIKINADNMEKIEKLRQERDEYISLFEQVMKEKQMFRAKLERAERQQKLNKGSFVKSLQPRTGNGNNNGRKVNAARNAEHSGQGSGNENGDKEQAPNATKNDAGLQTDQDNRNRREEHAENGAGDNTQ